MSLPAFAKHGVTRRCCLPLTERWHSGRTDWTSPAAALAGAGVIPGVARAAYQHRMAQFTTAERRHAATRGPTHTKRNIPRAPWPGARS